jgi:hypothetical protein
MLCHCQVLERPLEKYYLMVLKGNVVRLDKDTTYPVHPALLSSVRTTGDLYIVVLLELGLVSLCHFSSYFLRIAPGL